MYRISYTKWGRYSLGLFFIGVFKIFRFEVMFFDKIVKIDPIFSCHAELGTPLNYSISPLQANNAPMRTCVKDRRMWDDRHALGVTRTMDELKTEGRGTIAALGRGKM